LPEREGTSEDQKLAAKLMKQKLQVSSGSSIKYFYQLTMSKKMIFTLEVFKKPPEGFTPHVEIAGCYIEMQGKLLLLKYAESSPQAGKWGVPAGKLESGESPIGAARRELFEETGVSLDCQSQIHYVSSLYLRQRDVDYIFHLFKVDLPKMPMIQLSQEHQAYHWATSKDIEEMPLIAGAKEALENYRDTSIKRLPHAHICCYLILKQENKILLGLRKNTGYSDGLWSLIAGHVESGESATAAMLREAKEEIGIKPLELKMVHMMHRQTNRLNVDLFFECEAWEGFLQNLEPEKCEDLVFFSKDALPLNRVGYHVDALQAIARGEFYSEEGWNV